MKVPEIKIIEEEFETPDYEQRMERACELIAQMLYKYHIDKEAKTHKRLLDIGQLSERLNVKKNTIYSWVSQKKVPYLKIGGNVRFDPEKIERWLKKKEVKVRHIEIS